MKTKYLIFFLLITNLVFGQTKVSLSSDEKQFYNRLIDAFRENSIEKEKINWKEFKKKVLEKALISKDSAIILALDLNGNPHTFYKTKSKNFYQSSREIKADSSWFTCPVIDFKKEFPQIGYLEIPAFRTDAYNPRASHNSASDYIKRIIDSIKSFDQNELKGWIIDLRNNSGGNMWPMLISLTPFYPNGTIGYFIGDKRETTWSKSNGQIWFNESSQTIKYFKDPVYYKLKNNSVKVVVLIGPRTSSSGEAVAISTKSIKTAKLLGSHSSGFSTANASIKITDDEYLILTSSVDADCNKVEYWNGIDPDFNYSCNEILLGLHQWFSK
jgi:C-terminal processing protease CtpA/Prc